MSEVCTKVVGRGQKTCVWFVKGNGLGDKAMGVLTCLLQLLRGSPELIDLNFGPGAAGVVGRVSAGGGAGLVRQVQGEQTAARAQGQSAAVLDTDVEEVRPAHQRKLIVLQSFTDECVHLA